jgi:hypothetical protein
VLDYILLRYLIIIAYEVLVTSTINKATTQKITIYKSYVMKSFNPVYKSMHAFMYWLRSRLNWQWISLKERNYRRRSITVAVKRPFKFQREILKILISARISTDHTSINTLVCIVTPAGSYKITVSLNMHAMNFNRFELQLQRISKTATYIYLIIAKSKDYNIDRIVGTFRLLQDDTLFSRITVTYRAFT